MFIFVRSAKADVTKKRDLECYTVTPKLILLRFAECAFWGTVFFREFVNNPGGNAVCENLL